MAGEDLRLRMLLDAQVTGLQDILKTVEASDELSDEMRELVARSRPLVQALQNEAQAQNRAADAAQDHQIELALEVDARRKAVTAAKSYLAELQKTLDGQKKATAESTKFGTALKNEGTNRGAAVSSARGYQKALADEVIARRKAVEGAKTYLDSLQRVAASQDQSNQSARQQQQQLTAIATAQARVASETRKYEASLTRQAQAQQTATADAAKFDDSLSKIAAAQARVAAESKKLEAALAREGAAQQKAATATNRNNAALNQTASAADRAERELRQIQGQLTGYEARATAAGTATGALRRALAGISVALAFREFTRANSQLEQLTRSLTILKGNAEDGQKELAFLAGEGDRLGFRVGTLTRDYLKFTAALEGTNLEGDKGREIFTNFTGALANVGADTQRVTLVLNALGQIASKTTVSMEELRQQLGDSLPGSVRLLAESLGISVAELVKLVSQGKISSDTLLEFSRTAAEAFGANKVDQVRTYTAAVGRLGNAWDRLLQAIGGSGAFDALTSLIEGSARLLSGLTGQLGNLGADSDAGTRQAADNVRRVGAAATDSSSKVKGLKDDIDNLGKTEGADSESEVAKDLNAQLEDLQGQLVVVQVELARTRDAAKNAFSLDSLTGLSGFEQTLADLEQAERDLQAQITSTAELRDRQASPALQRQFERSIELADALDNLTAAQKAQLEELRRLAESGDISSAAYQRLRDGVLSVAPAFDTANEAIKRNFTETANLQQKQAEYQRLLAEYPQLVGTISPLLAEVNRQLAGQATATEKAAKGLTAAQSAALGLDKTQTALAKSSSDVAKAILGIELAAAKSTDARVVLAQKLGDSLEKERKQREDIRSSTQAQTTAQKETTEATEETEQAAGKVASIGQIIRNEFAQARDRMAELSDNAEKVFITATKLAFEQSGFSALPGIVSKGATEVEQLTSQIESLDKAIQQTRLDRIQLPTNSVGAFIEAMKQAEQVTERAFLDQARSAERFFDTLESGNERAIRNTGLLDKTTEQLRRQFNLLDDTRLNKLTGEIRRLNDEAKALGETLRNDVLALQRQLADLRGDNVGRQELDNAEALRQAQEALNQAQATGDQNLIDLARTRLELQQQANREQLDAIKAQAEAQRQADRDNPLVKPQSGRDSPSAAPGGGLDTGSDASARTLARERGAVNDLDAAREAAHQRDLERTAERAAAADAAAAAEINAQRRIAADAERTSRSRGGSLNIGRNNPLGEDSAREVDRTLTRVQSLSR